MSSSGAGDRTPLRTRGVPPAAIADPYAGPPYRISFVCTGNICRSPMAEVITRSLAEETELPDGSTLGSQLSLHSAGTGPWHEGERMHDGASDALARAGYPRHLHVARQFARSDIGRLDLLIALDRKHQQTLRGLGVDPGRIALLRSFEPSSGVGADVPDPYYGDDEVFDACLAMIEASCIGLVAALASNWDSLWEG